MGVSPSSATTFRTRLRLSTTALVAADDGLPMTIAGTVTGIDGSPFPGVTVTIRNTTTNDIHTVTTDTSGHYSHTTTPGNYSVIATYSAYRANISYGDIAQSRTNVDFTMRTR